MMSPQLQILFLPPLMFLLLAASSTSDASDLQDTCKSVTSSHKDIGYDYCLRFFQGDRGSAAADRRGLTAIAARITAAAARNTAGRIASLKASIKDKEVAQCLSDCAEVYEDAVSDTAQAVQAIASGSMGSAVSMLSSVLDAPDTCEQGFTHLDLSSPMAAADAAFDKAAVIALVVTSMGSKLLRDKW